MVDPPQRPQLAVEMPWAQVGEVQGPPMAQQHLLASQVKKRASKNQSKSKPRRSQYSSCSCTIFPGPLSQCQGTSLLKRMAPKLISPRNAVKKPGSARGGYQAAGHCKASTKAGRAITKAPRITTGKEQLEVGLIHHRNSRRISTAGPVQAATLMKTLF